MRISEVNVQRTGHDHSRRVYERLWFDDHYTNVQSYHTNHNYSCKGEEEKLATSTKSRWHQAEALQQAVGIRPANINNRWCKHHHMTE